MRPTETWKNPMAKKRDLMTIKALAADDSSKHIVLKFETPKCCPFCGSKTLRIGYASFNTLGIRCEQCSAQIQREIPGGENPERKALDEVLSAWNNRCWAHAGMTSEELAKKVEKQLDRAMSHSNWLVNREVWLAQIANGLRPYMQTEQFVVAVNELLSAAQDVIDSMFAGSTQNPLAIALAKVRKNK